MKIRITFKTPDAVRYALDQDFQEIDEEGYGEDTEELYEQRERAEEVINQFVSYGEYVTIEFDTEKGTAEVVKV